MYGLNIEGLLILCREEGAETTDIAWCSGIGKKRTTRNLLAIECNNRLWDDCSSVGK